MNSIFPMWSWKIGDRLSDCPRSRTNHVLIYRKNPRLLSSLVYRSSHRSCSVRKSALRNFAKFTGKHLCQSISLLIKLQKSFHIWTKNGEILRISPYSVRIPEKACNFIETEILTQDFYCKLCEISKNTIFTEHRWVIASEYIGHDLGFFCDLWELENNSNQLRTTKTIDVSFLVISLFQLWYGFCKRIVSKFHF